MSISLLERGHGAGNVRKGHYMAKAKVIENTDLEKDTETNVVSNTNTNEYLAFVRQRENAQAKEDKVANLEAEVATLKELVAQLLADRA